MKKSIFNSALTSIKEFVRRHDRVILASISILVVTAGITAIVLLTGRANNPLPNDIRNQLTFSPFIIFDKDPAYTTNNYKFISAENNLKILSFIISTPHGNVSLSEYPQPPQFTDIPEYKDRFLSNVINQYDTVPTSNGTIYLGRTAEPAKKQIGFMLERGLLVFINPDKELTDTEWRSLGERLEIYKAI